MMAPASASWSQATTPKKMPCVQETPACSPIMAKWIPAAPRRRPATIHPSTGPTVVALGRGGRGDRPPARRIQLLDLHALARRLGRDRLHQDPPG